MIKHKRLTGTASSDQRGRHVFMMTIIFNILKTHDALDICVTEIAVDSLKVGSSNTVGPLRWRPPPLLTLVKCWWGCKRWWLGPGG